MAHTVHVVFQVTLPIVGEDDAAQLAVPSEVETSISGKHQQTSHVPPANLLLGSKQEDILIYLNYPYLYSMHFEGTEKWRKKTKKNKLK